MNLYIYCIIEQQQLVFFFKNQQINKSGQVVLIYFLSNYHLIPHLLFIASMEGSMLWETLKIQLL